MGQHSFTSPEHPEFNLPQSLPATQPSCHKLMEIYAGELAECYFRLRGDPSSARYLRATLKSLEEPVPWRIHEVWARLFSAKIVEI